MRRSRVIASITIILNLMGKFKINKRAKAAIKTIKKTKKKIVMTAINIIRNSNFSSQVKICRKYS